MGCSRASHNATFFCRQRRGRAVVGAALLGLAAVAAAEPPTGEAEQAVRDAWLDGRLETAYALNTQLSALDIQTHVENGVVRLDGSVDSGIARDLATDIAEGMEGVTRVESRLKVSGARAPVATAGEGAQRSFGQWVEDLTATARVKSNLVANGNTKGLSIDVDTQNDVVTLKGEVSSRKEQMLAEMIARNTDGIASVRNQLAISEQL